MNSHQSEILQLLLDGFAGSPINCAFGMTLHFDEDRRAIISLPYNPKLDHGMKGVHGGVIATMMDNAGWFTAAAHYGVFLVTVEYSVRLLEPVMQTDLWSTGTLMRAGKRLAICSMEVRKSESDHLIAIGNGTFSVTTRPLTLPTQ